MGKNGKYFTSIVNVTSDFVLQVEASCKPETLDLLNDTYRFVFSHHQTISESAMHTYYSALPFTPHDTRLYHLYEQEASHSITVLQGLSPEWTSCLSTVSLHVDILSISPDGMWLALGEFRTIMILDARTTASRCQISLTGDVVHLAFSPSESTLATVTSQGLGLWDTTTGTNLQTQRFSGLHCRAVAFSSQGQYLLLSIDKGLHLCHGTDASELSVLSTDCNHQSIVFAGNDKQVITGSQNGYIHFFTLSGNRLSEIQQRRIFNGTDVQVLVLRHDGERLASGGLDGAIRIYDLPSQSLVATLRHPDSESRICSIAYHPTEEELAVGDHGGDVILWRQKETPSDWIPSIHSNQGWSIEGIAYCQNGTRMYTNANIGGTKLWTTTVTRIQEPPKHTGEIFCGVFNQPTSLLATGGIDTSIILWNSMTGDYCKTLLGHESTVTSLVFSTDGVLLASGEAICITIVWDVMSGSCLHKLGCDYWCDHVVSFSEDNAHLTTRTDGECFVWELKSGKLLERRDRSVDHRHNTPYSLKNLNGWQTGVSQQKKCKYGLCRPPGEYAQQRSYNNGPILGDRAALLCDDGRVLILDISRVMDVYMDPAVWLDDEDRDEDEDEDEDEDDNEDDEDEIEIENEDGDEDEGEGIDDSWYL